jgi:alpha-L-fucosidase
LKAGEWIKRYPHVVYGAGLSPFGHGLPWGDVTTQGNVLNFVIFDWPADGNLFVPGLRSQIASASLRLPSGSSKRIAWRKEGAWTRFSLPANVSPDRPASVLEVRLKSSPGADETLGVYPNCAVELPVEFGEVTHATKKKISWMEKFGEWKAVVQASDWQPDGKCSWSVDVARAGDYYVDLVYKGKSRVVWAVETGEGARIQNQQAASTVYHQYPVGMITFKQAGRHTITVHPTEDFDVATSLKSAVIRPAG